MNRVFDGRRFDLWKHLVQAFIFGKIAEAFDSPNRIMGKNGLKYRLRAELVQRYVGRELGEFVLLQLLETVVGRFEFCP